MSDTSIDRSPRIAGADRMVLDEDFFLTRTSELGALTDRERCAVAGISKASLHRWRAGTVTPSLVTLGMVARRLGVRVEQLIRKAAP